MALSSSEAEYVLEDLMIKLKQTVKLLIDNKSTINLAKNPHCLWEVETHRNQFHYLRDQVNKCKVIVVHCSTNDQIAVVFTKLVKSAQLQKLNRELQVVSF